jgi:luciferase-like monooxygenase
MKRYKVILHPDVEVDITSSWRGPALEFNQMAERPRLFKINPEMQRWCALLEEEVMAWPEVTSRPMFGMTGLYNGKNIFAAIPRTRAPETPRSLLIKLPDLKKKRLKPANGPGKGWITFELTSADDIAEAIQLLERAYEENS